MSPPTYYWMYTTSHSMFLWQDDSMRRKAHHLMWPGKPYVDDRPSPALLQRGGSLRQTPGGVMQDRPSPALAQRGGSLRQTPQGVMQDRPSPALVQRGGSLRQTPRGVMQNLPSYHNLTVHSPSRPQPGMSSRGQLQMKPAANGPAPNAI